MDINKFTQKSIEAIKDMQSIAAEYGNQQLEQVHLLYALLSKSDGLIPSLASQSGVAEGTLSLMAKREIEKLPKVSGVSSDRLYMSRELESAFTSAEREAEKMHDEYVSVEHLMLGLFERADMKVKGILRECGFTRDAFLASLKSVRG